MTLAIADSTRPARILIVDDNDDNRGLLEIILHSEGFLPMSAAGGEEALHAVACRRPDMILLDVMMPGMDGYQVAKRLKGNPDTRNIPIIMVTGLDERNTTILALSAGVQAVMAKPIDRVKLLLGVRALLGLAGTAVLVRAEGDSQRPSSAS